MSVRFWGCWEYDRCLGMWRGAIAISGMLGSAIAVWDVGRAIASGVWGCDSEALRRNRFWGCVEWIAVWDVGMR
ncbi:MAG: hypothetical protein HEP80_14470 [Dolichospermum sp. UKL201]|nr:MAG: hypothetical protein HEP80_14470 [Dolichospermum sp. UKL201]